MNFYNKEFQKEFLGYEKIIFEKFPVLGIPKPWLLIGPNLECEWILT